MKYRWQKVTPFLILIILQINKVLATKHHGWTRKGMRNKKQEKYKNDKNKKEKKSINK